MCPRWANERAVMGWMWISGFQETFLRDHHLEIHTVTVELPPVARNLPSSSRAKPKVSPGIDIIESSPVDLRQNITNCLGNPTSNDISIWTDGHRNKDPFHSTFDEPHLTSIKSLFHGMRGKFIIFGHAIALTVLGWSSVYISLPSPMNELVGDPKQPTLTIRRPKTLSTQPLPSLISWLRIRFLHSRRPVFHLTRTEHLDEGASPWNNHHLVFCSPEWNRCPFKRGNSRASPTTSTVLCVPRTTESIVVNCRIPPLPKNTFRFVLAQTRHDSNPARISSSSRLRPMNTSWFRRTWSPHGFSGWPSKSIWTPWKTKRRGSLAILINPFIRKMSTPRVCRKSKYLVLQVDIATFSIAMEPTSSSCSCCATQIRSIPFQQSLLSL